MTHHIPLGDTGWSVWRDVVLRSAGFPAVGLAAFTAPEVAAAADALLAGDGDAESFDKAFERALADTSTAADAIAADPLVREAVTWQSPTALIALDGLLRGDPAVRNARRRKRETSLLRYWQRYCGKSETIGFFGPVCWGSIGGVGTGTELRPGPALIDRRLVVFEAWALMAYADRVGTDLAVRRWWAPVRPPHLTVDGRRLRQPLHPPVDLTAADAWLLAHCDGRRSADEVVAAALAEPELGLRSPDDGFLLLDRLVERGLVSWDAALPNSPHAERVLRDRIAAVADPATRERIAAGLDRLCAARDAVAAAAGDPERLAVAIAALNSEFTTATGAEASRLSGQMYAGRTLIYEETSRDLSFVLGGAVLDALAAPLAIVLRAARWLTAEFGAACRGVLTDLYEDLRGEGPVRLADIWALSQLLLFAPDGPAAAVADRFTARWAELFGLAELPADRPELTFDSAELAVRAERLFAAERPGWHAGRIHSPDIQICAPDVDAINRGAFLLVLGELHPAYVPFDSAVLTPFHPDPAALRAALDADLGPARLRVLPPDGFPRQTTRTTHFLDGPSDVQLGIDTARGADPARMVPAAEVRVERIDGELVAVPPDGRRWPLIEVFAHLLGSVLLDSFKLVAPAAHTPRITIDRLVVARRTWRTTVAETGLVGVTGERDRFLAVRRWKSRTGLPEQLFIKIGTEVKPCYVDLRGPLHAQSLCAMLDAAARTGADVDVTISELLPGPADSWLTDAEGRGYVSELRLQITDPATHPTSGEHR